MCPWGKVWLAFQLPKQLVTNAVYMYNGKHGSKQHQLKWLSASVVNWFVINNNMVFSQKARLHIP